MTYLMKIINNGATMIYKLNSKNVINENGLYYVKGKRCMLFNRFFTTPKNALKYRNRTKWYLCKATQLNEQTIILEWEDLQGDIYDKF